MDTESVDTRGCLVAGFQACAYCNQETIMDYGEAKYPNTGGVKSKETLFISQSKCGKKTGLVSCPVFGAYKLKVSD